MYETNKRVNKMTGDRNPAISREDNALLSKYVTITIPKETATVQSQNSDKIYHINIKEQTCECPDYTFRNTYCKHLQAVDLKIQQDRRFDEIAREDTQGLIRKDLLLK